MPPVHDYVIDNSTGANVRSDINNALAAIVSNNSSSSQPTTRYAYMWWADTTTGILKIRNSANDGWVELLQLDGTLTLEDGSASTPGLAFRDDLNTGIFSSAADTFNVATGGVERMELGATTIFNEDGADVDFRIEGDTEANLFYVDAGNNHIGINDSTPSVTLDITGEGGGNGEINVKRTSGASCFIQAQSAIAVFGSNSNHPLQLKSNSTTALTIDTSQRVLIGTTTEGEGDADDLTIAGSANVGITIRSGTSNQGAIYFSDATSGTGEYDGFLGYNQSSRSIFLGAATSTRMTIDQRGHMGLGVVPDDSWPSNGDFRALQIGSGACVFGRGSGDEDRGGISVNYYHTGSAEKYLANGNASGMLLNDGDIDFFFAAANSSGADAAMSKTTSMRIAADGDIGIGTLDPNRTIEIKKSSPGIRLEETSSGGSKRLEFFIDGSEANIAAPQSSQTIMLSCVGNDTMMLGRSGSHAEVIINNGTTTLGNAVLSIHTNGSNGIGLKAGASNTQNHLTFANTNGEVGSITTNGSATSFNTSSDYRLKENAVAISDGITRLKTLIPYRFNFKADASTTVDGFFAHEVTAVPEAITGTKDEVDSDNNPIYQGIDQSKLVPLLVAAVKELITKVEALESA